MTQYIIERVEEGKESEELDSDESFIRDEAHEWEESEIRCHRHSATRTTWEDSSDDASECTKSGFLIQVSFISESISAISECNDKQREEKYYKKWNEYIEIDVERFPFGAEVPESHLHIGSEPPRDTCPEYEKEIDDGTISRCKYFSERGGNHWE